MALPEKQIDGHGNITMFELHHFIIQLVRIPRNEQPTIIKIMQLAYNFGQFSGSNKQKSLYKGISKLNSIHKFISRQNIKKINQELQKHNIDNTQMCQDIQKLFT